MKATIRKSSSTLHWSSPFWLRIRFYFWYAYPILILGLIAFIGKQVLKHIENSTDAPIVEGTAPIAGTPLNNSERAEVLNRFLRESGGLEEWTRYGKSNHISAGGWIMYREAYRIFEATKLDENLEVDFLALTGSYGARFERGALKPQQNRADPNDDPMAQAVSILLDSYGDYTFSRQMLEALQSAPLNRSFWNGRPSVELSFRCAEEGMDVILTFERSEMLLREREDTYDTGLVVKQTFHGYRSVGKLALPDEIVMTIAEDGPYQFGISTLNVRSEPVQVTGSKTAR